VYLKDPDVISHAKHGLERINRICYLLHKNDGLRQDNLNVRVVLAMNLVLFHNRQVFDRNGPLETRLQDASRLFYDNTENIVNSVLSGQRFFQMPEAIVKEHCVLLHQYLEAFADWKKPDEERLMCRIRSALRALYQALHFVPNETNEYLLRREFKIQINHLRDKLQRVGGERALIEFDQEIRCPPEFLDVNAAETVLPPAPAAQTESDIRFRRFTNEMLAHELLINAEFRLSPDMLLPYTAVDSTSELVRISFNNAYWDDLVSDLGDPPTYDRVFKVLSEFKDAVGDFTGGTDAHRLLEVLNLEEIQARIDSDTMTWPFIVELIKAMQNFILTVLAPFRAKETEVMFEPIEESLAAETVPDRARAFANALRYFLDRINAIRLDTANARLTLIAPIVRNGGVDYEKNKFQEKLDHGIYDLYSVTSWLLPHVDFVEPMSEIVTDFQKLRCFMTHAVVGLVCSEDRQLILPCTLEIDANRIRFAHREIRFLATACTLVIRLRHHQYAGNSETYRLLTEHTIDYINKSCLYEITYEAFSDAMLRHSFSPSQQPVVDSFVLRARHLFSPTDPIQRLVTKRIKQMLIQYLINAWQTGFETMNTNQLCVLEVFGPRHLAVGKALHEVMGINMLVHQDTYNMVIGRIINSIHEMPRRPNPLAVALVAPVLTVNVEVDGNAMPIQFYNTDDAGERYLKATVGLIHAVHGSLEFTQLLGIQEAAAREGGFPL